MPNNINEYVDQNRWLLNNGLFTDAAKDNLHIYGGLANKSITAVELVVDTNTKHIKYVLYAPKSLLRAYNRYIDLHSSSSLWDMWRVKRLLKRHGNLEMSRMLNSFVKTYCGPAWNVDVSLKESSEYEDTKPTPSDDSEEDRQSV
jgi:hypothetical protein